jgi:Protein of unknown function (DUF2975)
MKPLSLPIVKQHPPSSRLLNAPLLGSGRFVVILISGVLLFALVMVTIGAGAAVTVEKHRVAAKIAEAGLPPAALWGVFAGMLAIAVMLSFALRFMFELWQIIASVDQGDPFTPDNAARLARMGWLMVAVYAIRLPLAVIAKRLGKTTTDPYLSGDIWGAALLILTLFILARVFAKGSEMRAELEGTI